MIEASKLVTLKIKSQSQLDFISAIKALASMWPYRVNVVNLYHVMNHDNYAATRDVVRSSHTTMSCINTVVVHLN